MEYQAGDLHDLIVAGRPKDAQETEETLARVRKAFAQHGWDDQSVVRQFQADISLLLVFQDYFKRIGK